MKIIVKKSKFIMAFLILYMFCIIYAPPFFPINLFHIVSAVSLLAIIILHKNRLKEVVKKMGIYPVALLLGCCIFFFLQGCFIASVRSVSVKPVYQAYTIYQSVLMMVEIIVCATYVACIVIKYNIKNIEIFRSICCAGIIQFLLAGMAYLSSDIRFFFLDVIGSNADLTSLYSNYNDYLVYRGYGFAISLLDEFGYGTGIIGGIAYILGRKKKGYYGVAILMGLTTLLNSRTGLIMMAVFVICDWLIADSVHIKKTKIFKIIAVLVILVVLWFFVLPAILDFLFYNTQEGIIKSTVRDLKQVLNLNYHTLQPQMWEFVDDIFALFLGTGAQVSGMISTVGYVNIIWEFGILGTIFIYFIVMYFFRKVLSRSKKSLEYYKINFALLVIFFIVQLKMPVLNYSAGGVLLFSIPLWSNLILHRGEEVDGN